MFYNRPKLEEREENSEKRQQNYFDRLNNETCCICISSIYLNRRIVIVQCTSNCYDYDKVFCYLSNLVQRCRTISQFFLEEYKHGVWNTGHKERNKNIFNLLLGTK